MDTLLLDENWDLTVDDSGNIAVATGAYAQAQDAASQIKLFTGELYYDNDQGIPYWEQILGQTPRPPLIIAKYNQAAKLVPGVVRATTEIVSVAGRTLTGTVFIADADGEEAFVRFTTLLGLLTQ